MLGSLRWLLTFTLALALVVSFGLHTVDTKHKHFSLTTAEAHHDDTGAVPHNHGPAPEEPLSQNFDEYFHGIEQKFFLVIVLALIFVSAFWLYPTILQPPVITFRFSSLLKEADFLIGVREYSYLSELFSRGILNPKLF